MPLLLVGLLLVSATPPPVEGQLRHGWHVSQDEKVDSAQVLAISLKTGWAAVKVISHAEAQPDGPDQEAGPTDCGYPGMKATPTSGVRLMTFSLKTGEVGQVFQVYAVASKKEECSADKDALAKAKATFTSLGLNIAKPPVPDFGPITGDSTKEHVETEDAMDTHVDVATIFTARGRPFYQLQFTYQTTMAGNAGVSTDAFIESGKVVFFHAYFESTMRSYEAWYSFSPVLDLPK